MKKTILILTSDPFSANYEIIKKTFFFSKIEIKIIIIFLSVTEMILKIMPVQKLVI